jgi:hypothetical protein
MALRVARLPGIRFETVPPQHEAVLPRMDIAVFVGFAASGPLHILVPVEDVAQFEEIFGSDLPLAWDAARGEVVTAYLAPVVRDFFRNGGRRCWIIRVAGDHASTSYLSIPGLAQYVVGDLGDGKLTPAYAAARSPGSWADSLRLATALTSDAVRVLSIDLGQNTFDLELTMPSQVGTGDLLRLSYPSGDLLMVSVAGLDSLESGPDTSRLDEARLVRAHAGIALWFRPANGQTPANASAILTAFNQAGEESHFTGEVPLDADSAELDWPSEEQDPIRIDCGMDPDSPLAAGSAAFPTVGSLVKVEFSNGVFWLAVEEVDVLAGNTDSLPASTPGRVRLGGHGLWCLSAVPSSATGLPSYAEKLTFELWTRQGNAAMQYLTGLGFAPDQPRYWSALPSDEELFTGQSVGHYSGRWETGHPPYPPDYYRGLWAASRSPRFPVLGGDLSATFIPIAIPAYPQAYARPDPLPATALEYDDLDVFSANLFLDPDLAETGTEALAAQADFLRYTGPAPRRLRGIHAALSVDEATIIAVPDATQRGWSLSRPPAPLPPGPPIRRPHPDWLRALPCDQRNEPPKTAAPDWGQFLNCGLLVLDTPVLQVSHAPDEEGSFRLTWNAVDLPKRPDLTIEYVVEESAFSDFSETHDVYRGPETWLDFLGYNLGDYYYHVSAEVVELPGLTSDWSNSLGVRVGSPPRWQVEDEKLYSSAELCTVQGALLRMCAVRGDLFAVLAAPVGYRPEETQEYAHDLRASLGYGELRALSFGALYHPWTIGSAASQDDTGRKTIGTPALRLTPPDGICCGVLARRAVERGAWVAPANEVLRGIVALDPAIDPASWLDLQEAHVNLLRREPSGFVCLDADTLSDDPDWRPVNVRRLICLLRRLALRYGPTYVFEPNSTAFQRLVKGSFEGFLDYLFVRNAFAGKTPASSYQVNVHVTPEDIDAGRFIIELRVAPSLPMRFITVRLVQSGEHSQVLEGG